MCFVCLLLSCFQLIVLLSFLLLYISPGEICSTYVPINMADLSIALSGGTGTNQLSVYFVVLWSLSVFAVWSQALNNTGCVKDILKFVISHTTK